MIGSIAPNGSSISMMSGSAPRARATPTRWAWPPESSLGKRSRYWSGSRPTVVSSDSTCSVMRSFSQPNILGTVAMFCAIVWCGKRPICWMT